jgi:lysophospholipase L1-like esterase
MCVSAVVDNGVNFGIGGDTTAGVLERLPTYKSLQNSKAVVLAVGFNDLRQCKNYEMLNNYRNILSEVPERPKVVVCSVLPIDENCRHERYNDRITKLNGSLEEMCLSIQNCKFLDLTDKLRDEQGNLSPEYHEGDGVHLNSKGYSIYNEALKASLMSF